MFGHHQSIVPPSFCVGFLLVPVPFTSLQFRLMKESFVPAKVGVNAEPATCYQSGHDGANLDPNEAFSIKCLLRTVRVEDSAGLLSRINYCFPSGRAIALPEVMRHAERLNALLVQSKVYVVKDIDGDRGHFLQMDSVLKSDDMQSCDRRKASAFLKGVTSDIERLLKYFQQEADSPNPEGLTAVAQHCNVANLRTAVSMVA